MNKNIASLEKKSNWQATAKQNDGKLVAIMRARKGGRFEGKFYLYTEDWHPFQNYPPAEGMSDTPLHAIKSMFASGELTLVSGTEPQ
jgi:hypothetical protein